MSYVGNYKSHECKIRLSHVSKKDQGSWRCEIESFMWGPLRGDEASASIHLNVKITSTPGVTKILTTKGKRQKSYQVALIGPIT